MDGYTKAAAQRVARANAASVARKIAALGRALERGDWEEAAVLGDYIAVEAEVLAGAVNAINALAGEEEPTYEIP